MKKILILVLLALAYNVNGVYNVYSEDIEIAPMPAPAELEARMRVANAKMSFDDAYAWIKKNNPDAMATIDVVFEGMLHIQSEYNKRLIRAKKIIIALEKELANKR